MKKFVLIPIAAILMSFSQCDKNNFDKKPPISFSKKYFQDWVGGRPGSKGTLLTLVTKNLEKKFVFDSIFFNDKVAKVSVQVSRNQRILTANFIASNNTNNDLIVSGNPKEEFGNKPPQLVQQIPFKLKDNEAVMSYLIDGKKRYFMIENIAKEKILYYP